MPFDASVISRGFDQYADYLSKKREREEAQAIEKEKLNQALNLYRAKKEIDKLYAVSNPVDTRQNLLAMLGGIAIPSPEFSAPISTIPIPTPYAGARTLPGFPSVGMRQATPPTRGQVLGQMLGITPEQAVRKSLGFPSKTEAYTINDEIELPEGYRITGYDSKGNPIIRENKTLAERKYEAQQEENKKKQDLSVKMVKDSTLDALNTISEIEAGINNFGLLGPLPSIPGTKRMKWEANVGKLLSGKVLSVMTELKNASRTGATGFGQLSEKELELLYNAATALRKGLRPRDAQEILNDMKVKLNQYLEIASQDEEEIEEQQPPKTGGISEGATAIDNKFLQSDYSKYGLE